MSNFSFIPTPWADLAQSPQEAERQVLNAPLVAAFLCRKSLEEWVRWMYERDADLELPHDTSLSSLMHAQGFKNLVAPIQFNQINLIRKLGNTAVHTTAKINPQEALYALKLLHGFIGWAVQLYHEERVSVPRFDESLLPKNKEKDLYKHDLQVLERNYHESQSKLAKLEAELASIKAIKAQNQAFVVPPTDPDEALTRKLYIDTLLREAGWDPHGFNVPEYPVKGMPQGHGDANGNGFADYVLWGDDGKPLAVVEAKRTQRDPRVGQHQAKLYADCLEKEYNQRPVIFYSNGFRTFLWDDVNYPPREVFGFYTKDELQLMVQRRSSQKTLATQPINNAITDRPYQHEAIRRVAEALDGKHREALLIMATGTGKTRVAASIVDLLSKANWAKRVLFLADRNALIHQAKINLNQYLPHLPAVDLTKEKEDESSRLVFSTYQTIIHMIDGEADGNNRFYGVGHFDVIIFDEIHRSVYNRYKHIFKYFDGIRIGLTATPKSETDRDTYGLFDMEPNNPTFAYELEQAVNDGFLVPPKAISVPIKFQRSGIKYADLNEEEKRAYEEQFSDPVTGAFPDEIDAAALNKWLFNTDTVDKVIGHLMKHGLKVEGGDKLAKTIVFARSHTHAKFIEERFNKQYPAYKGEFLKVIDYQEEKRDDLLNKFKDKAKMPQIAASVDMLDTGIDVPEVCNLVFFKPVRSSAKFWQMIGRGTRLCKDLFGTGQDKKEFVIFDFCENFEFFNAHPKGKEGTNSKSLSQRLFELRLRLALVLLGQEEPELKEYGQTLLGQLIKQTQALNGDSFVVRQHWAFVEKYRDPNAWNALSDLDHKELRDHIAPLMLEAEQDELAKRFDALMLDLQLSVLNGEKKQATLIQKVVATAGKLSKKASLPAVAKKMDTLHQVQQKVFWEGSTILGIEKVRIELRDIIQFLDSENTLIYFTMFEDEFTGKAHEHQLVYHFNDLDAYKRKVEQYLKEQSTHFVIHKLRNNLPITQAELESLDQLLFEQGNLGTKEEFTKAYGKQPLGKFIRSIVGLDIQAAKLAFAEILSHQTFNAQQIKFIDTIINFLTVKGMVEPAMLFESPFTDINSNGIGGLFDNAVATKIINLLETINHNAEAA
ncbi:type I restriction enzyme R subunit [Runella defluvii]|uniref:Type I restriction enzyme R subunit n=1 Tax=Runella defluvii TaxID=370973 RepID=A0A7W5ZQJ0_9BACT|nr:DEAD/DEAH box helicase family protein [Runella defluvii]MBB3839839.1 type I restriction enzyme R subunit [Runella defluvii]